MFRIEEKSCFVKSNCAGNCTTFSHCLRGHAKPAENSRCLQILFTCVPTPCPSFVVVLNISSSRALIFTCVLQQRGYSALSVRISYWQCAETLVWQCFFSYSSSSAELSVVNLLLLLSLFHLPLQPSNGCVFQHALNRKKTLRGVNAKLTEITPRGTTIRSINFFYPPSSHSISDFVWNRTNALPGIPFQEVAYSN